MHRANGGYLILDAQQIYHQTNAWDALKRSLYDQSITVEPQEQLQGFPMPVSLKPQSIPLKVKVILLGERQLYYLLCDQDPHFQDLFKIAADFSNHIPRSASNLLVFSRLLATIVQKEGLLPLNRHAVAKMIDHSSRVASDTLRLYTNQRFLRDLLREANYWANQEQRRIIKATDIQQAIDQQIYRANRIETRVMDDYRRNLLLLETKGKKIGQINGLSVLQIGHHSFGTPSRITATVRLEKERSLTSSGKLNWAAHCIRKGFLFYRVF